MKYFKVVAVCFLSSACMLKTELSSVEKQTQPIFQQASLQIEPLTGVGYAVISSQPGATPAQKRLMAISASKAAAYRSLAEQVHGTKIDGNTTLVQMMVQNDTLRSSVKGLVRGAKVVRINPKGNESYETVVELDRSSFNGLLNRAREAQNSQ